MATVRLNRRGLAEAATSAKMRREVAELAEAVADNVRAMGIEVGDRDGGASERPLPVAVYVDTTRSMRLNRVRAAVVLAHAAGQAVQAKHGALTKAAAQAGLDVRGGA